MNFVEEMDQFLVGRIAFPTVNYVLNRKDILGRYRKLLLTEHYSKDAIRKLQFQKLSAVLRHAYPNNSRETVFSETGASPRHSAN